MQRDIDVQPDQASTGQHRLSSGTSLPRPPVTTTTIMSSQPDADTDYASSASGPSIPVTPRSFSPPRPLMAVAAQRLYPASTGQQRTFRDLCTIGLVSINPLPTDLLDDLANLVDADNENPVERFYTSFIQKHFIRKQPLLLHPKIKVVEVDLDSLDAEDMQSWRSSPFATILEARRSAASWRAPGPSERRERTTSTRTLNAVARRDLDSLPPSTGSSIGSSRSSAGVRHPDLMLVAEIRKDNPIANSELNQDIDRPNASVRPAKRSRTKVRSDIQLPPQVWRLASFVADFKFIMDYLTLLCQVLAYAHEANYAVGTPFAAVFRRHQYSRILVFSPSLVALEISLEAQQHVNLRIPPEDLLDHLPPDEVVLCRLLERRGVPVRRLRSIQHLVTDQSQIYSISPIHEVARRAGDSLAVDEPSLQRLSTFISFAADILLDISTTEPLRRIRQDMSELARCIDNSLRPINLALTGDDLNSMVDVLRPKLKVDPSGSSTSPQYPEESGTDQQRGSGAPLERASPSNNSGGKRGDDSKEESQPLDPNLSLSDSDDRSRERPHTPSESSSWGSDTPSEGGFDPLLYDIVGEGTWVALFTAQQMDALIAGLIQTRGSVYGPGAGVEQRQKQEGVWVD